MKTRHLITASVFGLFLVLIFVGAARTAGAALSIQSQPVDVLDRELYEVRFAATSHQWYTETVDSGSYVGWYSSLALNENDDVFISYIDLGNGRLRYADSSIFNWWGHTTVDQMSNPPNGGSTSLQMNADAPYVMISYYDVQKDQLNLASYVAANSWVTETVASPGGMFNDLALDRNDPENIIPHISFYEQNKGDLVYASKDAAGSWYTETVDSVGDVGKYTSIALTIFGVPRISYYDADNKSLKYAWKFEDDWYNEHVDSSSDDVGWDTSLALDQQDFPRISYYDKFNGALKYAEWDSIAIEWISITVDSTGDVGQFSSLAIDSNNKAHISYYDEINGHLNYATISNSNWLTETVDSSEEVGAFSSLALDSSDRPHISYFDDHNHRLLFATTTARPLYLVLDDDSDGLSAKDANPGDGVCADALGRCTLRAAIEETNGWGSERGVAIVAGKPLTVTIDSSVGALPVINEKVWITGIWDRDNDQPGFTIDGGGGSFDGLSLAGDYSTIEGLQIRNFDGAAIRISSANNQIGRSEAYDRNVLSGNTYGIRIAGSNAKNNTIQGNYIGTSPDGESAVPNMIGVYISDEAADNTIGGDTNAKGNLISGNTNAGVNISGSGTDRNKLGGNIVGATLSEYVSLPNGIGVQIDWGAAETCIGCSSLASNTIHLNNSIGISLNGAGDHTQVISNSIGLNKDNGIDIYDTSDAYISMNSIFANSSYGIRITDPSAARNTLTENKIFANASAGINLDGGNNELAAPTVISATGSSVTGTACPNCVVEIFSDNDDEGEMYHGSVKASSSGDWTYNGTINGPNVTATATDDDGNTSEFSTAIRDIFGGTCTAPLEISCGETVSGNFNGHGYFLDEYSCLTGMHGQDVFYGFSLTQGSTYTVTATISNDKLSYVALLTDCSSGVCFSSSAHGGVGQPMTVGGVPGGDYFLAIDPGIPIDDLNYTLTLECISSEFKVLLPLIQMNVGSEPSTGIPQADGRVIAGVGSSGKAGFWGTSPLVLLFFTGILILSRLHLKGR